MFLPPSAHDDGGVLLNISGAKIPVLFEPFHLPPFRLLSSCSFLVVPLQFSLFHVLFCFSNIFIELYAA